MSYEKELFRLEVPHGDGDLYFEWQPGSGVYLATTGSDYSVAVFTRQGKLHEHIRLAGHCTGFGWDSDGDLLGMICNGSMTILLWDSNTGKLHTIETGLRDILTVITWAKTEPMLAVASSRGNITIYNHRTSKRIPVLGKHSKKIVSGSWSRTNMLALCSEDRTVSISSSEGDTLRVITLRGDPSGVQFGHTRQDSRQSHDTMVSVVVSKKALFLYNLQDPDNPVELTFQGRYGNIVAYEWYGDGFVLIGFSTGYLISISTNLRELGHEQFQIKNHHSHLSSLAVCASLNRVATCGDNILKVQELNNLSDVCGVITLPEGTSVERVSWSSDSQLLCLADNLGSLVVYLSHLPRIYSKSGNLLAVLTSLSQVTVHLVKGKSVRSSSVEAPVEPSLVGVGPFHLILGMNNRTWIYDIVGDNSPATTTLRQLASAPVLLGDREYVSNIHSLSLNAEYTSALLTNKLHLQLTESVSNFSPRDKEEKEMKIFPEPSETMNITCHSLTTDFLVYASNEGDIRLFGLEDWSQVSDYKHKTGIKAVYPDSTAARIIVIDNNSEGFLYSPVDDTVIPLMDFPVSATGVLWDMWQLDRNVFIVFDKKMIITYVHMRFSIDGSRVEKVGETKLVSDQVPLLVQAGTVSLVTPGAKLTSLNLATHNLSSTVLPDKVETLLTTLDKHLALTRYSDAWNTCMILNTKEAWQKLASSALRNLNIETAIRVYSHLGDAGMVMSLERLLDVENKKLLAGFIAEILGEFDKAQGLYLESSEPENALRMRQHLLQWDQALQLARNLAPDQVPYTALEYANQLELTGQYSEALVHYERALGSELKERAMAGVARTSLRVGDHRRGMALAHDSGSKPLMVQCADILESTKKLNEAAMLYEKAEDYDKAAGAYVGLKNWRKVGTLLPKITNSKIFQQFAKARESDGDFVNAVEAYIKAGDTESSVRLLLDKINQPQRAIVLVQETRSIEAAKMVAKFFEKIGDYSSALKFLVVSRCESEALRLCKEQGLVELYAKLVTEEMGGSEEGERQLTMLAAHFQQQGKLLLAAKCYYHAAHFSKAMKNLINYCKGNTDDQEAIALAIEVVGAANDDSLANQLIELLLGEVDGEPRDPKHVFKLYKARKQYKEAARTAVIIASEELSNGNYSVAHSVLVGMCMDLHDEGLPVSNELTSLLTLLHSYRLVRIHVKHNDHLKAARMLLRVADNISKFPAHIVPILTSTVIECHRANLRASAFNYAVMLMRPEYKSKIEPKYVKKMEGVVRKPPRGPDNKLASDPPEDTTPCPFCGEKLIDSQLTCSVCHNTIPFCIATGRHIVKGDFTVCPNCQFPAIKSELISLIEAGERCPMCQEPIEVNVLRVVLDPEMYLYPHREE